MSADDAYKDELLSKRAERVAAGKPVSEIDHKLDMIGKSDGWIASTTRERKDSGQPTRLLKEEKIRRVGNLLRRLFG